MRFGALLALALLIPACVQGASSPSENSTRVEAYLPTTNTWRQEADLPVPVDHAMAAGHRGRVYLAGGYGADRGQLSTLFAFTGDGWTRLAPMPESRAAGDGNPDTRSAPSWATS